MLSSFCSPLNSIPDIPGIISVVTAGIISVVIGDHFGGGDHFDGGDHFGGGTRDLFSQGKNIFNPLALIFSHSASQLTLLHIADSSHFSTMTIHLYSQGLLCKVLPRLCAASTLPQKKLGEGARSLIFSEGRGRLYTGQMPSKIIKFASY